MLISSTRNIMLVTAGCLIAGLLVEAFLFGWRILANASLAVVIAALTEALCLKISSRESFKPVWDGSSAITALIISAALPPAVSHPVLAAAVVTAIALGKYAYGGLGNNVFNPAMVGYALVLLSFPLALSNWPGSVDGLSGATALTTFTYREAATVEDIWLDTNGFGVLGAAGWEWVNVAFAGGGLLLITLKLIAWRIPVAMLLVMALAAIAGYDTGSSASHGSPAYHWFSGGTMLAAFFVATDPVTHPISHRGQWLFGLLIGALVYLIRVFGSHPDGIAFAVLLGNAITPYLNRRFAFEQVITP